MRILIDIGHPAHVHYFKNFIGIMKNKGHEFCITSRDKEITFHLLNAYGIPFLSRGKGARGMMGKLSYMLKADLFIYRAARRFKPDLFMSFGSPYAAQASALYGKPHIAFDDTEHAKLELLLYPPFTKTILTPGCFKKDLGKKHLRFDSYMEFTYLHPNYFRSNEGIRSKLGLDPNDRFVLFRYISWDASHDVGQSGIPDNMKRQLIDIFTKKGYKIFISAEKTLEPDFASYAITVPPEEIHDVIHQASFFVGESGTMANEACILGTPAFFINSLNAGVFEDEASRGLLYSFRTSEGVIEKVNELLNDAGLEKKHKERSEVLRKEKIDTTSFMVWFVENYPESHKILQKEPTFQNRFLC